MNSAAHAPGNGPVPGRLLCHRHDLVEDSGICVLLDGQQIALFYLPGEPVPLYAIANHDPRGGANVLSRGMVGDLKGQLVVASPLYKHHYNLLTGQCLEDPAVRVRTFAVELKHDRVFLLETGTLAP